MKKISFVNFHEFWRNEASALAELPLVAEALDRLEKFWEEIAQYQQAKAEYELRLAEFKARAFDWPWLIESFEPIDLAALQLAVCQEKFPEEAWEILSHDEDAVVTNSSRSLVCDMHHSDSLSPEACLGLAGDPNFAGLEEAAVVIKKRAAKQEAVAKELAGLLAKYHGEVTP
jgi:hypothetical protein